MNNFVTIPISKEGSGELGEVPTPNQPKDNPKIAHTKVNLFLSSQNKQSQVGGSTNNHSVQKGKNGRRGEQTSPTVVHTVTVNDEQGKLHTTVTGNVGYKPIFDKRMVRRRVSHSLWFHGNN